MTQLNILVLAAGEGTRMKSLRPKVLHEAAGKALVEHVLDAASVLNGAAGVVLGKGADQVKARLAGRGAVFFLQKERRGSGDAVKPAASWLKKRGGDTMVLCGDAPLLKPETIRALAALHKKDKNAATVLTARVPRPTGYGRIVRSAGDKVQAIVEEKDATAAQKSIDEINSGTYCFRTADLLPALAKLKPDNAKGEYYITDVIGLLVKEGRSVGALCVDGDEECLGVNDRSQLAAADKVLRRRQLQRLMADGVTVVDPDSTYVDAGVTVGPDTVIWPQTYLLGKTRVGSGCRIGPMTVLEDADVSDGAQVGPFARLRGGARIGRNARVGNFVEVKKSTLAEGVKAGHLAYLGDATIGADVNIGAGTITCNYDGAQKHQTVIGAGAFIGSNANLVAPVTVGRGAVVGAGSTITKDVPADALALERSQQISKSGWAAQWRARQRPRKPHHG